MGWRILSPKWVAVTLVMGCINRGDALSYGDPGGALLCIGKHAFGEFQATSQKIESKTSI
jgi:hypothetical protein